MNQFGPGLALSVLVISYVLTVLLIKLPRSFSPFDRPNSRSLHTVPTPRTGGLAIIVSMVTGLCGAATWHVPIERTLVWVVASALFLAVVAFWDDWVDLSFVVRILSHGLAAAAVVWGAGLTVVEIPLPMGETIILGRASIPFTLLFMMWMTNLYNFMDGMDGFAGGMTAVGFGVVGIIAKMQGHQSIAMLSVFIAFAAGGFLIHNFPPAKIFMGDVGSVPLGFIAGATAVWGIHSGLFDIWVPLLVFSPFIVDASVTLLRRLFRGERVWQAHRQHFYQRLVLAGWGHRKTVLAEWKLMVICGAGAVFYVQAGSALRWTLLLLWTVGFNLLAVCVRNVEKRNS